MTAPMLSRRACRHTERGQTTAEFALLAPVLLALVFGIFDFGRGMSANITVTNSSREGARYAASVLGTVGTTTALSSTPISSCNNGTTAPADASGQGKAWKQLANANLDLNQVTMTAYVYKSTNDPSGDTNSPRSQYDVRITCSNGAVVVTDAAGYVPQTGDYILFEVKYQYTPNTPLINQMIKSVQMDQITTMVIE